MLCLSSPLPLSLILNTFIFEQEDDKNELVAYHLLYKFFKAYFLFGNSLLNPYCFSLKSLYSSYNLVCVLDYKFQF